MTRMLLTPKAVWLRVSAAALLLTLGPGPARAQGRAVELTEGPITITFEPPPGFAMAPKEEVEAARREGRVENFIFSAPQAHAAVLISVFGEHGGAEEELSLVVKNLEERVRKNRPNIEWLGSGEAVLNGKKWARLRYKETLPVAEIFADLYITDWAGRYVSFNFACAASTCETQRAAMEKSAGTIGLGLLVVAPVQRAKPARRRSPRKRRP